MVHEDFGESIGIANTCSERAVSYSTLHHFQSSEISVDKLHHLKKPEDWNMFVLWDEFMSGMLENII